MNKLHCRPHPTNGSTTMNTTMQDADYHGVHQQQNQPRYRDSPHGRSPNDVRKLHTVGGGGVGATNKSSSSSIPSSQSIKIVPTTQCTLEQQLSENEAMAEDREAAMFRRIVTSRNSINKGTSSFLHKQATNNNDSWFYDQRTAVVGGDNANPIGKSIFYQPAPQESLIGALRYPGPAIHFDSVAMVQNVFAGVPTPLSSSYLLDPTTSGPITAEDSDEGVFDLEM